jgi:hypothetical protein
MNEEVRGIDIAHDRAGRGPRSSSCMAPSATAGRAPAAKPGQFPTPAGSQGNGRACGRGGQALVAVLDA